MAISVIVLHNLRHNGTRGKLLFLVHVTAKVGFLMTRNQLYADLDFHRTAIYGLCRVWVLFIVFPDELNGKLFEISTRKKILPQKKRSAHLYMTFVRSTI